MKRYLLMTATIVPAPAVVGSLAVADPGRRRCEYEQALRAAVAQVERCLDGVVLAENSGADLAGFRSLVPPTIPLELLSIAPRPADSTAGRGFLETLLVADAFEASDLLSARGAHAVKATGRYRTTNLPALVRSMDFAHDLGFNSRRLPGRWVDLWHYFANARGIGALAARADRLREGTAGTPSEQNMWRLLDEIEATGVAVQRRFGVEPRLSGVRAWDGRSYSDVRQRAKWAVRSAAKRVVPSVWI